MGEGIWIFPREQITGLMKDSFLFQSLLTFFSVSEVGESSPSDWELIWSLSSWNWWPRYILDQFPRIDQDLTVSSIDISCLQVCLILPRNTKRNRGRKTWRLSSASPMSEVHEHLLPSLSFVSLSSSSPIAMLITSKSLPCFCWQSHCNSPFGAKWHLLSSES